MPSDCRIKVRVEFRPDQSYESITINNIMSRRNKYNEGLAAIRKATGLSQLQFSEKIGCSFHSIQSIETKRLGMSRKMAVRIQNYTGACARSLMGGHAISIFGGEYATRHFDEWRKSQNELTPDMLINLGVKRLESFLMNVSKTRILALSSVYASLQDWISEASADHGITS